MLFIMSLNEFNALLGLRRAKRAGAQLAARGVYWAAARRLADEMSAAGIVLESHDGWTR